MSGNSRVLLVGREQDLLDGMTRRLEMAGYIVTATMDDGVALDLAGASEYGALLIGGEVSVPDRRYVTTEARNRDPSLVVLTIHNPESVLTQLRQAGIRV